MGIELWKYAKTVEENYQPIAEILLNQESESWKVERLLSYASKPLPGVKRWYSIWSEGILAEALACFPEAAFPRLLDKLRDSEINNGLFVTLKALTMWGDYFAEELAAWVKEKNSNETDLQLKALHGLILYSELLHIFQNSEEAKLEPKLQSEDYPELAFFMRDQQLGAPPASRTLGTPRPRLIQSLSYMLIRSLNENQQLAVLRCLWKLYDKKSGSEIEGKCLAKALDKLESLATGSSSRAIAREAAMALCRLSPARGEGQIRKGWLQDEHRRPIAAEVLGTIRTKESFEMLKILATDPDPEIRQKAISSMESFASEETVAFLKLLKENDTKVRRQLIQSRSKIAGILQKNPSPPKKSQPDSAFSISPLALLRMVPDKYVFSEKELNASVKPKIISDVSSSRRCAVEVGLLDRRGDSYRLSEIGIVVQWVETYLKTGLSRFAERSPTSL